MNKNNLKEISLVIYNSIFQNKKEFEIENEKLKINKFSRGIKYIDYLGYRFIEQNRQKKSKWGKMAREGHKIMWVIKGRKYIAQVLDENFKML
jgi:hypothetical protein